MVTYPCWQAFSNGPRHFSGRGFQEWKRREIKTCQRGVGEDPQNLLTRFNCPLYGYLHWTPLNTGWGVGGRAGFHDDVQLRRGR